MKSSVVQFVFFVLVNVVAEEVAGHAVSNILELHPADVIEENLRSFVNLFWHIQTAVLCQTLHHRLLKVGHRGISVCTVVIHSLFDFH